jgi:uncharacterized protein (DUF433 family)
MSQATLNREYDFSQSEYLAQDIESTPHIRGRRITVRDIGALVYKRKLTPATIADRFDLPEPAVHEALVFYHLNPEYFAQLEQSRQRSADERSDAAITPDEFSSGATVAGSELGLDDLASVAERDEDSAESASDSTVDREE